MEDLLEMVQPFSTMSPFNGVLLNAYLMEDSCLHILLYRQLEVKKMCLITNCVLDKKFDVRSDL